MSEESSSRAPFTRELSAVIFAILFLGLAHTGSAAGRQALHDHVPAAAVHLQPVGRLDSEKRLNLAIALPLRNTNALAALLREIYDPASPSYHHYLTPQQFAQQFGPSEQDYQSLAEFAKANNLIVTATHPNRTLLDVNASVADIQKAFHLNLRLYRHPTEARDFRAPDNEPSLDLSVPVLSISGLDDFFLPRPIDLLRQSFSSTLDARAYSTGSGPGGDFLGNDFRAAYAPGVSWDGSGQSVGLFQLDGYFLNDVIAYENLAGLPNVPLSNVVVGPFSSIPGANNVEVALDIDMVISMAPGLSSVIVYQGSTPNDILNRMATDNLAKQLSSSWSYNPVIDPARTQIFQQFAAQGQSFFQASGDFGAWVSTIQAPIDDPLVTVVGGTSLTTSGPGGTWVSETTWPGSGGGISTTYPIPFWQKGLDVSSNLGSSTMRNIPDVAALSDTVILLVADNGLHGKVGGTSAAAPMWAGFAALVNQRGATEGKPSLGFLNPALYAIGAGSGPGAYFHDITTGNNTNSSSSNRFFAVPGYDLATGWGTPAGNNSIAALLNPADALQITPAVAAIATGPAGGPLIPGVQTFSLTNAGANPLNWSLLSTSLWFNLSPANGSLTSGGPSATVTLRLNSAASNLVAGSYPAVIWFTNLYNTFVQSRQVTLAIVTPPVITAQPVGQAVMEGATATFSVGTATNALVHFQWRLDNGSFLTTLADGGNRTGSTTSSLTVSNISLADVGAYSVLVSNSTGSALSSNAFLTIIPWRPVIVSQPASQTVLPGQSATLSVTALGNQPLSYRWLFSGTNLTDGANVSGASSSALRLTNISPANAGAYSVFVSNALGSVTSTSAVLSVTPLTTPSISMDTLYSFSGGSDGGNPNELFLAVDGNFYGTAQNGGTSNSAGVVFRMPPSGTPTRLFSFNGNNNGAKPFAGLAPGSDGLLYGSTYQGGTNGYGSLFRISTNGNLSTLRSLDIPDGILPFAGLAHGKDGNFYGTAYESGASSYGTVFRLKTDSTFALLYSFTNGVDGALPYAGLTQGSDGGLYGTTYRGGAFGFGTIFKISTNGAFTVLYSLTGTNGSFPYARLVQASDGNFYGTTSSGGTSNRGVIFRISSAGQFTNLYSFSGGNDGRTPLAPLLEAADGNFYGTTAYGGALGSGTVFMLAPGGSFSTLSHFDVYNGANPLAALVQDPEGNFYGNTQNGGAHGAGVIYRLALLPTPPQITSQPASQFVFAGSDVRFNVSVFGSPPFLYRWRKNGTNLTDIGNISGSDSRTLILTNVSPADIGTYSVIVGNPYDLIVSADATLQVTSSPPVFVMQPTNQTLPPGATAVFAVSLLGNLPLSYQWQKNGTNLLDAGNVFGAHSATLTINSVTEATIGSFAVVVTNTLGSLTSSVASLVVIPVSAPGTRLTTLYSFTGALDGGKPNGLVQGTNGDLFGTTQLGGLFHGGSIFKLATNGALTSLVSLTATNGTRPMAALIQAADGDFYGTTKFGGVGGGAGTVFKMTASGSLTNLYSFTGDIDGANPLAALVQGTNGALYGDTSSGGSDGYGTVFTISSNGSFTSLYSFTNGADGSSPTSALALGPDGNFYGMTTAGASGYGNIFKITPGGILANVYNFLNLSDGSAPAGTLALADDGNFYGVTTLNTIQGYPFYGTIFKVTPDGHLTTLYPLNFADGSFPHAGLIEGTDGNFYGTTFSGGANSKGTVFRIAPNGSFASLLSFDGFDTGASPEAALVQATDGNFYGTTTTGGWGGQGTVFRLAITSAPQITAQPANLVTMAGANATFSVAVFGSSPLYYQWLKDGTNVADTGNLTGSTNRILSLTNLALANAGTYSVIVSNTLGTATSSGALLTLAAQPVFQSIARTNNNIRLTWSSAPGAVYQLQFKSNLTAAAWSNLGGQRTAAGPTLTVTDAVGSNNRRFYRVILLLQ